MLADTCWINGRIKQGCNKTHIWCKQIVLHTLELSAHWPDPRKPPLSLCLNNWHPSLYASSQQALCSPNPLGWTWPDLQGQSLPPAPSSDPRAQILPPNIAWAISYANWKTQIPRLPLRSLLPLVLDKTNHTLSLIFQEHKHEENSWTRNEGVCSEPPPHISGLDFTCDLYLQSKTHRWSPTSRDFEKHHIPENFFEKNMKHSTSSLALVMLSLFQCVCRLWVSRGLRLVPG